MSRKAIRVYADTSVVGGVFDEEFAGPSRRFFEHTRAVPYRLVMSTVVRDELDRAPPEVKAYFEKSLRTAEIVEVTEEAVHLQRAYVEAGIVGPKWEPDALHVATATVWECRVIVSWNFRHIVNFEKIPQYNGINLARGYGAIAIHSPQEVILDEDEDV